MAAVTSACTGSGGGALPTDDACLREEMTFPGDDFSYAELKSLVQRERVTSVDGLVPHLPATMRERFLLMQESESQQPARPDAPRILLFSKLGSVVMAFTSGPSRNLFTPDDSVEVIQFSPTTCRFEFVEVAFGPTGAVFRDGSTGAAGFGRNADRPTACAGCHTKGLRPNWHAYPFWPGAYGSYDDLMRRGSPEADAYVAFYAGPRLRGRTRHLLGFADLAFDPRYYDGGDYLAVHDDARPFLYEDTTYRGERVPDGGATVDTYGRPGLYLTDRLGWLNLLMNRARGASPAPAPSAYATEDAVAAATQRYFERKVEREAALFFTPAELDALGPPEGRYRALVERFNDHRELPFSRVFTRGIAYQVEPAGTIRSAWTPILGALARTRDVRAADMNPGGPAALFSFPTHALASIDVGRYCRPRSCAPLPR